MCQKPSVKPPVLVLYGSQTGNSRAMAKALGDEAGEHGFEARVQGMEQFKTIDFAEVPLLVIVSSTTGNGDAPDNADKFLRYIKRGSTPKNIFTQTHFCVFGLGDSNYEAFCEIPKRFDEHIERLGGKRMLKRCDADEVEGLETFFDPWKEKLWKTIGSLDLGSANDDIKDAEPVAAAEPTPALASPPQDEEVDGLGSSAEQPLLAPVVAARWLTAEDEEAGAEARRVLHVELDVSAAGGVMRFEAGDAIAVMPHHDDAAVAELLALLGVAAEAADSPLQLEGGDTPIHLQGELTPREALRSRVDVGSVSTWPPLPLLRLLLAAPAAPGGGAPDAALRARLAQAAEGGEEGRAAHAGLQREKPPLAELLARLRVAPALAPLLDALPPLAPRWYSLANASLVRRARTAPTHPLTPAARPPRPPPHARTAGPRVATGLAGPRAPLPHRGHLQDQGPRRPARGAARARVQSARRPLRAAPLAAPRRLAAAARRAPLRLQARGERRRAAPAAKPRDAHPARGAGNWPRRW